MCQRDQAKEMIALKEESLKTCHKVGVLHKNSCRIPFHSKLVITGLDYNQDSNLFLYLFFFILYKRYTNSLKQATITIKLSRIIVPLGNDIYAFLGSQLQEAHFGLSDIQAHQKLRGRTSRFLVFQFCWETNCQFSNWQVV